MRTAGVGERVAAADPHVEAPVGDLAEHVGGALEQLLARRGVVGQARTGEMEREPRRSPSGGSGSGGPDAAPNRTR